MRASVEVEGVQYCAEIEHKKPFRTKFWKEGDMPETHYGHWSGMIVFDVNVHNDLLVGVGHNQDGTKYAALPWGHRVYDVLEDALRYALRKAKTEKQAAQ